MPEQYRPLSRSEIKQLHNQVCTCSDWSGVEVAPEFKGDYITNVRFSGRVRLGVFEKAVILPCGVQQHSGIANTAIHNCTIGDNVYIASVHKIVNYNIGNDVVIENVGVLAVNEKTSFGNGTRVAVVNESGGREVPMYDHLSAQIAALLALYRHRPTLLERLFALIDAYADSVSSNIGDIAAGARISNTSAIVNVRVGPAAVIEGASRLENGTVNSSAGDPAFIGTGVCARNFITCSGSRIDTGAVIHNCFVGQAARIDRQFSADNCLFFANCHASHGEACSVFAGPYTTTHHKSSLLIAGLFSFFNAGSGTNQSNHLYRLGPAHQGIVERGCKTGSNSYLLWPARVGAFSTVIGSHHVHFDTSSMPFSYLIEEDGQTMLVPGTAIKSVSTVRDEQKWPSRDNRKEHHTLDLLVFAAISPYTMQNVLSGRNQLENIQTALKDTASESVTWNNLTIRLKALTNGINYYELLIARYLGEKIVSRLEHQNIKDLVQLRDALSSQMSVGRGRWIDLAGLITPEEAVHAIITGVEEQHVTSLDAIVKSFRTLYDDYVFYEWRWAVALLEDTLATNIDKIFPDDITGILHGYKAAVEKLNTMVLDDARKEFDDSAKIGYGLDGETSVRDADFEAVRGKFEDNEFIKHIRKTTAEQILAADNLIARLKTLGQ